MLTNVAEWRQDILEEHLSDLEPLWRRRLGMARSPEVDGIGLGRCDARIDANSDALALAEDAAWPMVHEALKSGDPALAAAAAMVVAISQNATGEAAVVDVLRDGADDVRAAIRFALLLRSSPGLLAALGKLGAGAPAPLAAFAWALGVLQAGVDETGQRERWMTDASAEARRLMWEVEARLAGRGSPGQRSRQVDRADYLRGLGDPDREVRRLSVEAAARSGQRWLVEHLRGIAAAPSLATIDDHLMLAVLAGTAEQSLVAELGRRKDLGWYRFSLLALSGSPQSAEALLEIMQQGPPIDAALAARAFHRITGVDVSGAERIPLLPDGAEPDESADEIKTCDVERAKQVWQAVKDRMAQGRWHDGVEAESLVATELPLTFDLETRWCLHVREAFAHPEAKPAFDGESFPFG